MSYIMDMRNYLIDIAVYFKGDYRRMLQAIKSKEIVPKAKIKYETLVIGDKQYPKAFYRLQYPPLVLFYQGQLKLLDTYCVSVVGSRKIDNYTKEMMENILKKIVPYTTIVSGCAKGVDALAHHLAHKTIGILGCGIDVNYPACNQRLINHLRKHQLVLSEYPPKVPPLKHHFPWRNRLVAALSSECLVMAATLKSGTIHTVNQAISMNSTIYCLPHRYDSPFGQGCHDTINQGAMVLTNELLNDLINKAKGAKDEEFSHSRVTF